MWGRHGPLAGGDNVAAPVDRWGPIHPEQLLASKPEVILMAGYESVSSAVTMQVGQDVSARPCASVWGLCCPSGLARVACGEGGRPTRSITAPPAASWMPPSSSSWPRPSSRTSSQDLDPLATHQAFYQHYLPIRPQGTFMLGIKTG